MASAQSKGLSLQYWVEAINCANYIVNRTPTKFLQGITPKESLTATNYQEPSLESFCDSLIREQDKLIHLGIISNADTSGKALLSQKKENSKPSKKQIF